MFKKIMSLALALMITAASAVTLSSCGSEKTEQTDGKSDVKIGVILVGDEAEGYTKAHMDGIKEAAKELNIADNQIIWKYKVPEDSACKEAAEDLVASGCNYIFSNSYGHQSLMVEAAQEFPDVTFVSMTGDFAAISGCSNFKNAFTNIYEARYVSGVVAGLKLKELIDNGTISPEKTPESFDADGNVKVGYVGAYPYAEVVSGYTAFFLGIKSVVEKVTMEVNYTNSWFDIDKEGQTAKALLSTGCVIIGQHADSTGAPAETEAENKAGKICYSVGYNIDMLETAPTAALTSATNNWSVYYKYAFDAALKGEEIATDWSKGYSDNAVAITKLGPSCAAGTEEYVNDVIAKIKDGSLKIFDTSKFTVDGKPVTSAPIDLSYCDFTVDPPKVIYKGETKEAIVDGQFEESTFRAAPYFQLRIDGIVEK